MKITKVKDINNKVCSECFSYGKIDSTKQSFFKKKYYFDGDYYFIIIGQKISILCEKCYKQLQIEMDKKNVTIIEKRI